MSIGIGLSINNARAVLEAIFNHVTEFKRTPKYQIEKEGDNWQNKKYRTSLTLQPVVELLLAAYFTVSLVSLVSEGLLLSIPFFILFQVGFLYIGLLSVFQSKNFAAPMNSMRLFFQRAVLLVLRRF